LAAVVNHQKEFRDYHNNVESKLKKLNRQVLNYHTLKERKEQQKRERDEKERLRLLKVCSVLLGFETNHLFYFFQIGQQRGGISQTIGRNQERTFNVPPKAN